MITVANRVETAARVKYAFDHKHIRIDELCIPEKILHIDSKVLDDAEARDEPLTMEIAENEISDDEEKPKITKKNTLKYCERQLILSDR